METGSLMRALGEWELIAACLFFMLLLPLIFFIASAQRRDRAPAKAPERQKRKSHVQQTAEDESGDSPQ